MVHSGLRCGRLHPSGTVLFRTGTPACLAVLRVLGIPVLHARSRCRDRQPRMASTQPLQPPRTPLLRLLSPASSDLDAALLPAIPVFDLQSLPIDEATRVRPPDIYPTPFAFDELADYTAASELQP